MRNVPCLDFEGREVTIKSLLNNVCDSILNPTAKTPIHFIHASDGVGKTRLFLEIVKMGIHEQNRLSRSFFQKKKSWIKNKKALLDDMLHIAVSFNCRTTYDPEHTTITTVPGILSHITLRILHIWLSKVSNALAAGVVTDEHQTLESVLSLVSRRAGRTHIVLYVDEVLKMYDSDAMNNLVVHLSAAQDEEDEDEGEDEDEDEKPPYSHRVCYSDLKDDIFARVRNFSGRDIICTPLP